MIVNISTLRLSLVTLTISTVSLLSACGGSSSPEPPVGSTPEPTVEPTAEPTAEPTTEPTAEPTPATPPTAKILFPWSQSATTSDRITVSGTASSAVGVKSVLVNGIQANISPPITSTQKLQSESTTEEVSDTNNQQDVEWSVELDVAEGETEVVVSVTDNDDQSQNQADTADLSFYKVPTFFTFDEANNRIVGLKENEIVDYQFDQKSQTVLGKIDSYDANGSCFNSTAGTFIYTKFLEDNAYQFRQYDTVTTENTVLHTEDISIPGESFVNAIFNGKLLCDSTNQTAYFLVNFADENGISASSIYKLTLEPEEVALSLFYETDLEDTTSMVVTDIALNDNTLTVISDYSTVQRIGSIALENGEYRTISDEYSEFVLEIANSNKINPITLVNFDTVENINTETGVVTIISQEKEEDPLEFSQVVSATIDEANSRVIIGDSDLDMIIFADIETGERSVAMTSGIGDGIKMISPRGFVLTQDLKKAYVVDDGSNAFERIIEVDLQTGNRRNIGKINSEFNESLTGIVLDEANQLLYASSRTHVYRIDIATEQTEVIASEAAGTGVVIESISSLEWQPGENRLIFTDDQLEAIIAINLENLERTIVSQEGIKGNGDAFANINSISLDNDSNLAYVSNQLSESVFSVDLESGDRTQINLNCQNVGNEETLQEVHFDKNKKELLVLDGKMYRIEIDSGECQQLPNSLDFLGAKTTQDGQVFTLTNGALNQYNPATGESVILSK